MPENSPDEVSYGDIRIVNADNYDWLPSSSIDLVLTDPPFNIARDTNFHTYEKNTIHSYRFDGDKGWDSFSRQDFVELLHSWAIEFARVLRTGGSFAVFCADDYVSDLKQALISAGLKPRRTITWRKPNAVPVNSQHMMMSSCEYVVVGVKGSKATFNSRYGSSDPVSLHETAFVADKVGSIVDMELKALLRDLQGSIAREDLGKAVETYLLGRAEDIGRRISKLDKSNGGSGVLALPNFVNFNSAAGNRLHPTEKPVPLLSYLISLMSRPGDTVLDPFSGSGSTGHASFELGRKAVLVEKDEEYFKKSANRIRALVGEADQTLI